MAPENQPLITFFMLVTNRDCIIANYAIKSYQKILSSKIDKEYKNFQLFVYLNCLEKDNLSYYYNQWKKYPYVILFDNSNKIDNMHIKPYPGQLLISPEGIQRNVEDYAENCDDIWSTELQKFNSRYVATVDADFEILNADFYVDLIQKLEANSNTICASTDYNPTSISPVFDTYSKRNIYAYERNHTWFCIYRKTAFNASKRSHYYFEESTDQNQIIAYDSASYFQDSLRKQGYNFISSPTEYFSSFVHYGAASKNKSLNRSNIKFYRKVFILVHKGLIKKKNNLLIRTVNKLTRNFSKHLFSNFLQKMSVERSTYIYDDTENKALITPLKK